jgi:2-keto-4-pentenoate hydratase/2-oxohepta-3-ene-1,7-dioic acid hydratase in catechol pathway
MRLVSYQKEELHRLGIFIEGFIIDAQTASCFVLGESPEGRRLLTACEGMSSLLLAEDEVWQRLRDIVDEIKSRLNIDQDFLISKGVLVPSDEVVLLAPVQNPGKVICAAGNFPGPGPAVKPDFPIFFLKPSSGITAAGMPIWISVLTKSVAYEVELAIVIGKCARKVAPTDALDYVAGYTLANDVGDRLLEKRTSQWTSGKMFDSFTPMGPWLVTRDEILQPNNLAMSTIVNGQLVQKGSTADMFFSIPELISILSDLTTLQPGDLILTGSTKHMNGQPNPVVALKPGDSVTIKIDGLGELTNPVEMEPECL